MASPDVAEALTRTYQDGQRRISNRLLAELLRLWRAVVDPSDMASFTRFAELAARMVGQRREESARAAARFYELFRAAQVVPTGAAALLGAGAAPAAGPFAPVAGAPLAETAVVGALRGAALSGFVGGRRAGQSEPQAARNALVKASGTATRLTLNGGRDTILASVRADPEALGWVRITTGDPCHFCLVLAARGPEYKSEQTAGRRSNTKFEGDGEFKVHDHCKCTARPVYAGTPALTSTIRAESIYKVAQRWARKNPDLAAKGTKNDALNNVRKYLAQRP